VYDGWEVRDERVVLGIFVDGRAAFVRVAARAFVFLGDDGEVQERIEDDHAFHHREKERFEVLVVECAVDGIFYAYPVGWSVTNDGIGTFYCSGTDILDLFIKLWGFYEAFTSQFGLFLDAETFQSLYEVTRG